MTTFSQMVSGASTKKLIRLLSLLCLAFALASCATGTGPGGSSAKSTKQLAYGISVQVPDGWAVDSNVAPEQATKADLETRAAKEPVLLLSMHRSSGTAEGKDAILMLFLVDATRDFVPQDQAAALTQQELDKYAQVILNRAKEAAKRQKTASPLLDWKVSKTRINGNLALVHQGAENRQGGKLLRYDANIYLPGGKGVGIKTLSDMETPGTEAAINGIINSIQVQ